MLYLQDRARRQQPHRWLADCGHSQVTSAKCWDFFPLHLSFLQSVLSLAFGLPPSPSLWVRMSSMDGPFRKLKEGKTEGRREGIIWAKFMMEAAQGGVGRWIDGDREIRNFTMKEMKCFGQHR